MDNIILNLNNEELKSLILSLCSSDSNFELIQNAIKKLDKDKFDQSFKDSAFNVAYCNNCEKLIELFILNGAIIEPQMVENKLITNFYRKYYTYSNKSYTDIIKDNDLDGVKYKHYLKNILTNENIEYAISNNKIDIIKYWVYECQYKLNNLHEEIMRFTSSCNNLELLKYFHSIGYETVNVGICSVAITNKNLDILKWHYSINLEYNKKNMYDTIGKCVKHDSLKCLEYIIENSENRLTNKFIEYVIDALKDNETNDKNECYKYLIDILMKLNHEKMIKLLDKTTLKKFFSSD